MKNIRLLLKIDLTVQKILVSLTCCSLIIFPFVGVMLCILGGWQLFSSIVIGYTLKDRKRGIYLWLSFLYLLFMWGSVSIGDLGEEGFELIALAIIFIVIPLFIASWYFRLTSKTLEASKKEEYIYSGKEGLEDILDSDELLERRMILDL